MTTTYRERLTKLRDELRRQGLDGFIVPRADEHLGEYVPASAERLAWLTGFTGSAGLAVVLADKAAVFTDGRYVLQLAAQTDPALWERRHITEEPPPGWLAANAPAGARIGYDPLAVRRGGARPLHRCRPGHAAGRATTRSMRSGPTGRRRRWRRPSRIRWITPGAAPGRSASRSPRCCARRSRMRR